MKNKAKIKTEKGETFVKHFSHPTITSSFIKLKEINKANANNEVNHSWSFTFTICLLLISFFSALHPSGATSQPTGIVSQPTGIVSQPTGSVSQPTGIVSQPTGIVSQPTGSVSQPTGSVSQPTGIVSQPTGIVSQPMGIVSQPTGIVSQPTGIVSQPSGRMLQPTGPSTFSEACSLFYNTLTKLPPSKNIKNYLLATNISERYKLPLPQV